MSVNRVKIMKNKINEQNNLCLDWITTQTMVVKQQNYLFLDWLITPILKF